MAKIAAIVDGNIPQNRVTNIYLSPDRTDKTGLRLATPKVRGGYADYVTDEALVDMQAITIEPTKNRILNVMTSSPVEKGAYVAADIDGTVGQFTDAIKYIGYALDGGAAGVVISIAEDQRANLNVTIRFYTRDELEAKTVTLLQEIAEEREIAGQSSMLKAELVDAILATQETL